MGKPKKKKCPICGSGNVSVEDSFDDGADLYVCDNCGHEFEAGGNKARRHDDYDDYKSGR